MRAAPPFRGGQAVVAKAATLILCPQRITHGALWPERHSVCNEIVIWPTRPGAADRSSVPRPIARRTSVRRVPNRARGAGLSSDVVGIEVVGQARQRGGRSGAHACHATGRGLRTDETSCGIECDSSFLTGRDGNPRAGS